MKQKLYVLDAFLIEKLKLLENDPPTVGLPTPFTFRMVL